MTTEQWTKLWKIIAAIAIALSTLATTLSGISLDLNNQQEAKINALVDAQASSDVVARGGNTPVYFDQGGARLTVGSNGTLVLSGTLSGNSLRGGSVSITGGSTSAVITHGFGTTPTVLMVGSSTGLTTTAYIDAKYATTASVKFAATPVTSTLVWLGLK